MRTGPHPAPPGSRWTPGHWLCKIYFDHVSATCAVSTCYISPFSLRGVCVIACLQKGKGRLREANTWPQVTIPPECGAAHLGILDASTTKGFSKCMCNKGQKGSGIKPSCSDSHSKFFPLHQRARTMIFSCFIEDLRNLCPHLLCFNSGAA